MKAFGMQKGGLDLQIPAVKPCLHMWTRIRGHFWDY